MTSGDEVWFRGDIGRVDCGSKDRGLVLILDILQEWSDLDGGRVGDTYFVIVWLYGKADVDGSIDKDKDYVLSSHIQVVFDAFDGPPLDADERELKVDTNHILDFQMRGPAKIRTIAKNCVITKALENWEMKNVEPLTPTLETEENEDEDEDANAGGSKVSSIPLVTQTNHSDHVKDDRVLAELSTPSALNRFGQFIASSQQNFLTPSKIFTMFKPGAA